MEIEVKLESGARLPFRAHPTDGGADLYAYRFEGFEDRESAVIRGRGELIVDTGVSMAIPENYIGDIRPRSSMFFKHGIICAGTIDSGYRGNIKVCLRNLTDSPVQIDRGDRIAQICIIPVAICDFKDVVDLPESDRGEGGFGSTGKGA